MDNPNSSLPYPAAELHLHRQQIRLVNILPGQHFDAISCELKTVSLDELPEYDSLSYVWGDPNDLRTILVNGVAFKVTRNLEAALRRLRHANESRLFWIDMICINQASSEERTHQVNLMQLIYSRAREVFLWFGDYAETTLQEEASPSLHAEKNQEYFSRTEAVRAQRLIEQLASDQHFEDSSLAADIHALFKLTHCSWWHRMWTIQEVILPPKVTIMVGCLQIPWETLAAAAKAPVDHCMRNCCVPLIEAERVVGHVYETVMTVHLGRQLYHEGRSFNLRELLYRFRGRISTDPRDKIFALLGLLKRDSRYGELQADYSLSVETIYQDIFIYLIREEGNLDLLVRHREVERTLDLPTWLPDWTAKMDESTANEESSVISMFHLYDASLSTQPEILWHSTTTTLGFKGILLDEIILLSESAPKDERRTHSEYLNTLWVFARTSLSHLGREARIEYLRLVNMDLIFESTDDPNNRRLKRATPEDYRNRQKAYPPHGICDDLPLLLGGFRFFVSRRGYIGLGPQNMQVGDTIHVFLGGKMPFVLRRANQQTSVSELEKRYEFVGHCYVQGFMDGEALHGVDLSTLDWFNLV